MQTKQQTLIERFSKQFWNKGLNLSTGSKTTPAETLLSDKSGYITENMVVDIINIGIEYSTSSLFVRGQYRGSRAWFQFPIKLSQLQLWTERLSDLHKERLDDSEDMEF